MTLTIDRRLMDAIYSARPKLFFAAADAAEISLGLGTELQRTHGIELIQFEAAGGAREAGRLHMVGQPEGDGVPLATPPTGSCLLMCLSTTGHQQLTPLLDWWKVMSPSSPPDVLDLSESAASEQMTWQVRLLLRLVEISQSDAQLSAEREVKLHGQLYELRQEYDQARGAMQFMQDRLAQLSQAPCSLAYAFAPGTELHHCKTDGEVIRQRLPIRSEGLSGFDLYIPPGRRSSAPHEHFLVTLRSCESDAALGTWKIMGPHLTDGWVRCAFPAALTSPYHQTELLVQWCGAADHCPGLALCPVDPWRELCATVNGAPLAGALAHAVWTAVPGAKTGLESAPIKTGIEGEARAAFTHVLGRNSITRAQTTTDTSAHYFDPLHNNTGFRLHPLDGIVAAAVFPDVCLSGTQSVAAVVQISHPAARHAVEYAMALTRAEARLRVFPGDSRGSDIVAISDWQSVPPDGSPHVVTLSLPPPCPDPLDLHVATRMYNNLPTTHQWADWLEIRVTQRGPAPVLPEKV